MGDPERLTAVMVSPSPEIEVTYLPPPALPPPLSASLDLKSGYAVVLGTCIFVEKVPTDIMCDNLLLRSSAKTASIDGRQYDSGEY
ncbi:hypothetical protein cyc_04281 [Cyclospora cayetanensis]|uniref:Uncharacterized protein n=1 Tax=Cyclospora cayetanensis TaxID=88456 RepID=A0A1D3D3D7_9EIME|nr:hypothetical protein cyc_04281 [Cyclospora cayetanensis]